MTLIRSFRLWHTLCIQRSYSHYVTTPIFYVNAAPHIGHLYSAVVADAHCRYQRLRRPAEDVRLCTGTDEHGTKVQQAAATFDQPVASYCYNISTQYKQLFQSASIAYDDFIRTSEERHKQATSNFWHELHNRGHIYSASYSGWYCVSDESFLTEAQLRVDESTGTQYSLESNHPVQWTEEINYKFKLSSFQDDVLYWLNQSLRVRPLKFDKILRDMLAEPMPDISVSRPSNRVHWAIPVPNDSSQTIYVWLDALVNYLTSVGYPNENFSKLWPPKQQIIGKDILKFHGIYWPAFLIAAGLEPPQQLFVHSHWTVDGQKMSKSKNNVVDPVEAAKTYTMEGLRYFLLREGTAHSDANYSNEKARRVLNAELADTLGNLLSRCCGKSLNTRQIYPAVQAVELERLLQRSESAQKLKSALLKLEADCGQHYDENNFYLVVDNVIATLHAANNFFECAQPWKLKSTREAANEDDEQRLNTILAIAMDSLRICGIMLQPIVPQLSTALLNKLNVPATQRCWTNLNESFAHGPAAMASSNESRPLAETSAVIFQRIMSKEEQQPKQQKRRKLNDVAQ